MGTKFLSHSEINQTINEIEKLKVPLTIFEVLTLVYIMNASKFYNDYNLIYNLDNLKEGSNSAGTWNYDYSIDVDPGFKDAANGDYSLANSSLAIGAGIIDWTDWGVMAPKTDMLGVERPNPSGSSPDLGPYENSLGYSP